LKSTIVAVTRKIAVKSVARKIMIRFLLMELVKISGRKFRVKDFISQVCYIDMTKITMGSDNRSLFAF
jgi:hypothetical protein